LIFDKFLVWGTPVKRLELLTLPGSLVGSPQVEEMWGSIPQPGTEDRGGGFLVQVSFLARISLFIFSEKKIR
jgi:hypothetical protein